MTLHSNRASSKAHCWFPVPLVTLTLLLLGLIGRADPAPTTRGPTTRPATRGPTTRPTVSLPVTVVPFYTKQNYPNPQTKPARCRPKRKQRSWFCDPNGLVQPADLVDKQLSRLRAGTKCPCKQTCQAGFTLAVGVVPSIRPSPRGKPQISETLHVFADHLRTSWKFGDCDNNLVLLVSASQPAGAWLSRGSAVGDLISDAQTTQILKQVNGVKGVLGAINDIGRLLGADMTPEVAGDMRSAATAAVGVLSGSTVMAIVGILAGFLIATVIAVVAGSYCGRKSRDSRKTTSGSNARSDGDAGARRNSRSDGASKSERKAKKSRGKNGRFGRIGRNKKHARRSAPSSSNSEQGDVYTVPGSDHAGSRRASSVYIGYPARNAGDQRGADNRRHDSGGDYDNHKSGAYGKDKSSDRDSGRNSDRKSSLNSDAYEDGHMHF